MKTLIKTILCVLIVYSTQVISSNLTFDFSNPSFSGEGYSSHILSIEQLQYNRKESVKDDLLSAEAKAARDAKSIDVAMQIKEIAPQALDILEEIMKGDETQQSLKAKVASDLLDRAGYSPPKKVLGMVAHSHFTGDDIEKIKARAKKIGIGNGQIIDGEIQDA